jgi:hypothetical protein
MKKLFIIIMLLVILTACRQEVNTGSDVQNTILPETEPDMVSGSGTADTAAEDSVIIDAACISRISLSNIKENSRKDYSDCILIKEFCTMLEKQKYTEIKEIQGEPYRVEQVELFDLNGKLVITLEFSDDTICLNRNVVMGKTVLEKGLYEADNWLWTGISFYLEQLDMGRVMDPEYIQYPAQIKIPEGYCELQLVSKGNDQVNKYDVYPMLYDFIENSFSGKEFEIVSGKKYYDYGELQSVIDISKKDDRCICIDFNMSDTQLEINSQSSYESFSMGCCLTLAEIPDKPGMYKLITDKMVFQISANSDFNSKFEALFSKNGNEYREVSPDEIKSLYYKKKPYYMEYVCSNLGVSEWRGREPDRLEIKKMKLNSKSEPYTVVNIYNPFDLKMLIYKCDSDDNALSFSGGIDFGGRMAGTEYQIEKAGSRIWIAGNICRGHGTGESLYYREWYQVNGKGVSLALSYPHDVYIDGPYGGYSMCASEVNIEKGNGFKIIVNYDIARRYNLYLDIADEHGIVELKGTKKAEFNWDEEQEKFVSAYETDESGAFSIPADCPEIAQKRDALLLEHYEQLMKSIDTYSQDKNEYIWKARGIKGFLDDCTDNEKKEELLKRLMW